MNSATSQSTTKLQNHCVGTPPLPARWEPWMIDAINSGILVDAIERHGSPLNLIQADPMRRNIAEIQSVADSYDVDLKIFFARKANKCMTFVETALATGCGIDTASENELRQAVQAGAQPEQLICTAAVKDQSLMRFCADHSITVAIDNFDELHRATNCRETPPVAIRLSGFRHGTLQHGRKLFSRFGFDVEAVDSIVDALADSSLQVHGLHFHLDGYDAEERISAIQQCLLIVDQMKQAGHAIEFLDIGGGFPIRYLDNGEAWNQFWENHRQALLGQQPPITFRNHTLGRQVHDNEVVGKPNLYPYYQSPVRADWFSGVLAADVDGETIADAIRRRGLQLRCEPGRSLMDGCGMTIARVEFRKQDTDGNWLIGLAMNRTQCRTTSEDFLVDPIVLPVGNADDGSDRIEANGRIEGYLVGAYCMESELLTWRRLAFPNGVRVGDLVIFPNTAGYLMHFLESRSHQFPLAKNVVFDRQSETLQCDAIDVPRPA